MTLVNMHITNDKNAEKAIVALQMALGCLYERQPDETLTFFCFNDGDDTLVTDTLLDEAGDKVTCESYPLPI